MWAEDRIQLGFSDYSPLACPKSIVKMDRKSDRQKWMMDLTVEIEADIRTTLEEALDIYQCTMVLDGEIMYKMQQVSSKFPFCFYLSNAIRDDKMGWLVQ